MTPSWLAVLFLGAVGVEAYLRLHLLSSQILLDDEWHSINHTVGRGFLDVATNLSPRDNSSVPFNLYNWWLYRDAGWSEWTIRLPSVVAGILSLVLLPWLVGRILGCRVAVVFAFLLAVSPVLVSYSRLARAYGATVLLAFAVLLLWHRWLTSGRARDAAATVLVGLLAVYAHPECLVAVFVPLLMAVGSLLALVAGPADIVVLHKVVMGARGLSGGAMDAVPVRCTSVDRFGAELRTRFGELVYEDGELGCFSVRGGMGEVDRAATR